MIEYLLLKLYYVHCKCSVINTNHNQASGKCSKREKNDLVVNCKFSKIYPYLQVATIQLRTITSETMKNLLQNLTFLSEFIIEHAAGPAFLI